MGETAARSHERRLGRLAVVGGLLAALLGALGGGVGTYLSNQQTAESNSAQAEAEFLRNQRQVAYAKLVSDARALIDYLPGYYDRLKTARSAQSKDPDYGPGQRMYGTCRLDFYNVKIVGSAKAADRAAVLFTNLRELASAAIMFTPGGTARWYIPNITALDSFIAQARADLGMH